MTIREYPFGFIVTLGEIALDEVRTEGFESLVAWDEISILHKQDEPVQVVGASSCGVVWLGHAVSVQEASPRSVAEEALEALQQGEDAFHEFLDYVVGRWAAVVVLNEDVRVYHDVLAAQPVYFLREGLTMCSHLPLLIDEAKAQANGPVNVRHLGQAKLWDETECEQIGALPPNFYLNLRSGGLFRYYPRHPIGLSSEGFSADVDLAVELGTRSVEYWASQSFDLYAALTAGLDTRLCASVALGANANPTFVTYGSTEDVAESDQHTLSSYKLDASVATKIAVDFGKGNIVLPIEEAAKHGLTPEEKGILDRNSLGKHARNFHGLYESTLGARPSICFVGTGLEVFKDYYVGTDRPLTPRGEFGRLAKALGGFGRSTRPDEFSQQIEDELWHRFDYESALSAKFPINNLIFWEVRAGRFQSEAVNCQSTAFLPINPLAIRKIFELAQNLSFYERKNSLFAQSMIRTSFPALVGYPVNGKVLETQPDPRFKGLSQFIRAESEAVAQPWRQNIPDILVLPPEHLEEGAEIFWKGTFESANGALHIKFENKYFLGRQVTNLEHFVRVDEIEVYRNSVGERLDPRLVVINGLSQGREVEFGIRSTRQNGKAWSNASKTRLLAWEEFEYPEKQEFAVSSAG